MLSAYSSSGLSSFGRLFAGAAKTIKERVDAIIEERVRPVLQMDGGDVIVHKIADGCVEVSLLGHCSGCPSRRSTLHQGILGCLQEEIPEIKSIKEIEQPKPNNK